MVSVFHRRCCVSLKYLNRSLWCFPLFPELIATCGGWAQEPAVLCGGARPEGQKDLKYSPEIGLPSKSPYNCSKKSKNLGVSVNHPSLDMGKKSATT